jgi:hypothetical protein
MSALRSGLAMLCRRSCGCGCSGSSLAASMGGRGMEIHQALRPVPPPLRPAAVHNLEVILGALLISFRSIGRVVIFCISGIIYYTKP